MTATKRPRAQRAGCHDAMLLLAACCGVKLLLVAVLVAVAAGPWALGILVALLGGLGVALARAPNAGLPSDAGRAASRDPALPLHHRRRHAGWCPRRSPGLRERT